MLHADNLCFSHHTAPLLADISFTLTDGQLIKITGSNGSGKTTLLKILALLLPQDSGSLHWGGQPMKIDPDEYREQVLYIGHRNALADELTPLENLRAAAGLRRRQPQCALADALAAAGLETSRHHPCRHLSAGQKRRAALARLQAFRARLWLLDEPLAALDEDGRAMLSRWVQAHRGGGGMAVCTMHRADDWAVPADAVVHFA